MSDFLLLFLTMLLAFTPPALIILGILLRREKYGIHLFLSVWFFISNILVPYATGFLQNFICSALGIIGINLSFRSSNFIYASLTILSFLVSVKVFVRISSPRKKNSSSPSHHKHEDIYYMESANGMITRVPASKLDSWLEAQDRIKQNPSSIELTAQEKAIAKEITDRIYGKHT